MWVSKRVAKKQHTPHQKLTVFVFVIIAGIIGIAGYSTYLVSKLFIQPSITRPIPDFVLGVNKRAGMPVQRADIELLLKEANISFQKIVKENTYYKILLTENAEVLLSTNRDVAQQITSLQVILTRTTMEGRHFTKLDLRFDKPVIVFRSE